MRIPWLATVLMASLCVAGTGCQNGTTTPAKPNGTPTITVIQPSRSLGLIPLGTHVESFEVANTGSGALAITELERSCSCAKVAIDRTTVPPGGTAKITVTISPKESEQKTASVTIHSNDTQSPRTRISVDWTARGAVSADVHELDFGLVRPNVPVTRTVKIEKSLAQLPATCKTLVRSVPPGIMRAELKHLDENQDRMEETWQITLQADENFKDHSGRVHLTFEGSDQGGMSLPVMWKIRKMVEAAPANLFLGVGDSSAKITKSIELTVDPGVHIKVSKAERQDGPIDFVARLVEVNAETTRVEIDATLPSQAGSYLGRLRVECETPAGAVFEVPVTCVVRAAAVK